MYENPEIEGILLVDASNAFNALNNLTRNLYSCEAELFVAGSEETILSREGTTQGGPESNGFYATSTMTLSLNHLKACKVSRKWPLLMLASKQENWITSTLVGMIC